MDYPYGGKSFGLEGLMRSHGLVPVDGVGG